MATQILSDGSRYTTLPQRYIRPVSERPNLAQLSYCDHVPIIDIGSGDRLLISRQIGNACRRYGFFQVINHGVPDEIVEKMQQIGHEFFELPVEEKMKLYSDDPSKTATFGTSISYQIEQYHNWRDYLRLHCYPLDRCTPEWPSKPPHFKELVENYCMMVRDLGMRILECISESLGLEKERIIQTLGDQSQYLTINKYPVCPEPELTYGLSGHTDPYALTILLQDTLVPGLQILIDGKWVAIRPCPNAFIINIGDLLEVVSNGVYKSVWHRVVVNSEKPRMSMPTFLSPCHDTIISVPKELIKDGSAPVFKDFMCSEYFKKFLSRKLNQEHSLELFFKN